MIYMYLYKWNLVLFSLVLNEQLDRVLITLRAYTFS